MRQEFFFFFFLGARSPKKIAEKKKKKNVAYLVEGRQVPRRQAPLPRGIGGVRGGVRRRHTVF